MSDRPKLIRPYSRKEGPTLGYTHYCPGCDQHHAISTHESEKLAWDFNGDVHNPTFSPSVRVRYKTGEEREQVVCHYFIRQGKIQYCGDCTHDLAGQTVPMRDAYDPDL